jgi:hypothetical protein
MTASLRFVGGCVCIDASNMGIGSSGSGPSLIIGEYVKDSISLAAACRYISQEISCFIAT